MVNIKVLTGGLLSIYPLILYRYIMVRKKGEILSKRVAIPYGIVKEMITNCSQNIKSDKPGRTRALLSLQYALGCRVGELAKEYTHHFKNIDPFEPTISEGMVKGDVTYTDKYLFIRHPNFKQAGAKRRKEKTKWHERAMVSAVREEWLYNIILDWVKDLPELSSPIFGIRRSRISALIDNKLKQYNPNYSTHLLRHSRATHIGEITQDPIAIKELLGHARVETSMKYVHYTENILKQRLGNKRFEDVLGKVVEE